jgi:hypothetical protein
MEAISMAMGILRKKRYALVGTEKAGSHAKVAFPTRSGQKAQKVHLNLVRTIEDRWRARYGEASLRALREPLERLVGEATAQASPLFRGLESYPVGWRASVPKPHTLPHFPLVLHRGGFPDGS